MTSQCDVTPSRGDTLLWGGVGGCHGGMSTKQRSKVRTFDLPLSTVCTEFLCTELDRNKR